MTTRHILRLRGADTVPFLQGLTTNDMKKLDDGLVYSAMLTPQGKYLADFFVLRDDEDVLLDVAASLAPMLEKRLGMYRLRADVTITASELSVQRGTGTPPEGAFQDPRHHALGWRAYSLAEERDDGSDWDALRVAHMIPETGIELTPETYILEARFEALNGVDFRKGCYVGQEVTARMKHKTDLRKGLARVAVQGATQTGSDILANGRPIGVLLTRSGDHAIAYLRFDKAKGEMTAGSAKITLL